MGDEKTLDNFIPKSESDFTEYAELIAQKLRPYEKSYHYIGLLKAVMRLSTVSLKGSDAKDVFSCLNDDMIIRPYDNKWESNWDDADLDDNEKKKTRFEALKVAPSDPAENMDDRFIWPVEPDFASDEELIIGPNEDVEDMNSYQDNNLELFDRDPRVWLEEQEQVWMKYFKGCK